MTKSKRNILIISVSILLVAVIAMAISFGILLPQQTVYVAKVEDEQPNTSNDVNDSVMEITPDEEYGIALTAAASPNPFTKTLTATIQPGDAPNKAVDWSVAWQEGDPKESETVTNYVTVTPTADGALTATVKCIKAFTGSKIVITVTTRKGGFKANCIADYVGYAQTITINTANKTVKQDSAWGQNMVELDVGTNATFEIKLDNDLHAVGSNAADYELKVEAFGTILVNKHITSTDSNSETSFSTTIGKVADDAGYGYESYRGMTTVDITGTSAHITRLFYVDIKDGNLVVYAVEAASSYSYVYGNRTSGTITETFKGYQDGKQPYAKITITEKNTGISASINIKSVSTVTGVSMSENTMTF